MKKQTKKPSRAGVLQTRKIKALRATARTLALSNDELRQSIDGKHSQLEFLNGQLALAAQNLQNIINETATAMIQHDEFTEKVRVAKVAAMNVYGTLSVVQRDLKTVIDTPGPDSTTTDIMDALLEGDLQLETPEPNGEVSKMVEGMFEDLGTDTQRGVSGFAVHENESTDLGLISDNGQVQQPDLEVTDFLTPLTTMAEVEQAIDDAKKAKEAARLAK